jgi:hypothetical protein
MWACSKRLSWGCQHMPVIPARQEMEVGGSRTKDSTGKVSVSPYQITKSKRTRGMAHVDTAFAYQA